MYKLSVFLILLSMGVILKKVDAMVQTASSPIVVEAHYKKGGHFKKPKKRPQTQEQFKKNVESKVRVLNLLKEKVLLLKDKVDPDEKGLFELRIRCAEKWVQALGGYSSTDTNIDRSYGLAHKELKAAKALKALKLSYREESFFDLEKDIDKLAKRFNEVRAYITKLDGDNKKALETMLYCAGEYINALKVAKTQSASSRSILSQGMKYVNMAETFLENRGHVSIAK